MDAIFTVVFWFIRFDGPYMASEIHLESVLTQEQIKSLSDFIIDQYGTGLPEDELVESIYLVMENVPGIETISSQSIQHFIKKIRYQYYGQY